MEENHMPEEILEIEDMPEQESEAVEEIVTEEEPTPETKKKSWLWPIVAGVIVLVMGLTVLFTLLGNKVDYNDYVKLGQYKGLVVPLEEVTVTDDEVQKQIDTNLANALTYAAVDRAAQKDDTVNIDYVGRYAADGSEFSGGSATDTDLVLGSGRFIDGFEDGLIGASAGDIIELPLTFPEDYQNILLAGAQVIFTVTVNEVKAPVEAVLNEEFVQANSDVTTVEEYRQLIHDQLLADKKEGAQSDREMKIWETVMGNCEILGYPEAELDAEEQSFRNYYEQYAAYYNMTLDAFITANNMTNEQFEELLSTWAKSNIEYLMVASVIADAEDITVSDEEYQHEVESFLAGNGFSSVEDYESQYNEDFDDVNGKNIRNNLLINKVVDFLLENSLTE